MYGGSAMDLYTTDFAGSSRSGGRTVSELELLREIVFAFQGHNGKILVQNPDEDNRYTISRGYVLDPSDRQFALRLCHLGWLFNKVNNFCNIVNRDPTGNGFIYQSFASALSDEVREYYRMIAIIEQQLHFMSGDPSKDSPVVSLQRFQVWTFDHFYRIKMLAILVEDCKRKRGGSLANQVYKAMQTGDPQLKACISRVLDQVLIPLRNMLSKWIFHGQIDDPYKEFFIQSHAAVPDGVTALKSGHGTGIDSIWHEKYTINESMLPEFIPMKEAKKILSTGKAVNLLLMSSADSGRDRLDLPGFEDLKESFEKTNVESLFRDSLVRLNFMAPSPPLHGNLLHVVPTAPLTPSTSDCSSVSGSNSSDFRRLLDKAFQEISSKAMKILFEDHSLMEHLMGLRQFLLLGQGDFIRHFMDLVSSELDKPAIKLQLHPLNCLLSQAIQGTNAQFHSDDILSRLECILLNRNLDECGWDVFSLSYQTRGPIGTILTAVAMEKYGKLFQHLWRSKRMEYLLTSIKKEQLKRHSLFLPFVPKLKALYHQNFFLLQEMLHFIQQMQYYIEFEVIECSWSEFSLRLKSALDIDQVVDAHESFLKKVYSRALMDEDEEEKPKTGSDLTPCEQLRAVYDVIVEFRDRLAVFDRHLDKEVKSLGFLPSDPISVHASNLSLASAASSVQGDFENQVLPKSTREFRLLSGRYHDMVQNFLVLLAEHQDVDVQFLNTRIDFNEHYKKRNKFLETSFTFSHRYSLGTSKNISFRE